MKATFHTYNNRLSFELEGMSTKDLFELIAAVQEVFDAATKCGACNSPHFKFSVRTVDEYKFYELQCLSRDCRARLSFGQAKKGGALFPKRKDDDGNYLPNGGWIKYEPNKDKAA